MKKTTLLIFDRQLLAVLGPLKQLHNCFHILFVQSLPNENTKAILELKKSGWSIEKILYTQEQRFIGQIKKYVRDHRVCNLTFYPPLEAFQKRMHHLLRKEVKTVSIQKFEPLIAEACEMFQRYMKKRLKRLNEHSYKMLNQKFSVLVDEYGDLVVEGLQAKPLDMKKQLHALRSSNDFAVQNRLKSPDQKMTISFEEEKEV